MKHYASPRFWKRFEALPEEVQQLARKNYALLEADPRYPSLHFKKVRDFRAVRVGLHYRALGLEVEDGVLWFWIGPHSEYDKLLG